MNYDQLLFSELRLVSVSGQQNELTDEALIKAMTVNEELLALGYTLAPKDIPVLAQSADLYGFADRIRSYIGDVKAKPMYPDFPSQVMELDEAVFRFHQMLHYLSTYGIERLTGSGVSRGWMPEMQDTPKTESDKTLLAARVLSLIDAGEKYSEPYRRILTKTERMTDKERMLIAECAANLSAEQLSSVSVTFKQNLLIVFQTVFADSQIPADRKLICLRSLCQHTGDVWKCTDYALTRARYHFKTSQKRLIVKLLESYPLHDFAENLILSNKKASRTLLVLQYLDYCCYSRKEEYAEAVKDLRAGKLHSWESYVKKLVGKKSPDVPEEYAKRPGMMLRHLTFLLRNGYMIEEIYQKLAPHAPELKTQTLVSLVSFFSRPEAEKLPEERYQETRLLRMMLTHLLQMRLSANQTALRNRKVCLQMPEFDLDHSEIRVVNKSSEGGYIRSGLAYKIPDDVKCIRFFIYWNDTQRVDVDLHASAFDRNGEVIRVGWNAAFKSGELVFSGDITHSDAAEYIDIDFEKAKASLSDVTFNINLYSGYETFREIDECFVGAMGISETGTKIKLYNPKNCFFTHYLTGTYRKINYGYIDVQNRVIVFDGLENGDPDYYETSSRNNGFSLRDYLNLLFVSQGSECVSAPEDADVILVMGKPAGEKELSLIDNNFFMET